MFVVETDTTRQLLVLSIAGVVNAEEARDIVVRVGASLEEMTPGFVALADFRWLESMESGAATSVAEIMEAFSAKQVSAVVRVMPDRHKDIGLNIMSPFHYGPEVRLMTFETLADAIQALARD